MQVRIDGYAWVPTTEMEPVQLAWLRNQLTVARVGQDCSLVNCFVDDEAGQRLGIAREFFYGKITKEHSILSSVSRGEWPEPKEISVVKVSGENEEALKHLLESLNARIAAGGILYAPAGWGKLDTVVEIIAAMAMKTLILVNSTARIAVWKKRFEARAPALKIGQLSNRKWETDGCHVVLAVSDSVASMVTKAACPPGLEKMFGLVVTDQIHQIEPTAWSKVIGFFHAAKRLGIASKMSRDDKADKVFEYHIGRRVYTSQVQRLVPKVRRVWTTFRINHPYFNPQLATRTTVVDVLTKNLNYNQDVVTQIMQALSADRKIVVFSDSFEHLKRMRQETEAQFKERTIKTDYIIDGMLDSDIEAASVADVIFASYTMAVRSFDIPSIDTVVLASPVKNPEQPITWSLYPFPGKKDPVVVDVRADQIPLCKEYAEARDRAYDRFFPSQKVASNG